MADAVRTLHADRIMGQRGNAMTAFSTAALRLPVWAANSSKRVRAAGDSNTMVRRVSRGFLPEPVRLPPRREVESAISPAWTSASKAGSVSGIAFSSMASSMDCSYGVSFTASGSYFMGGLVFMGGRFFGIYGMGRR